MRGEVRCGSRLCENSDVELARRSFVSITLNNKRTALAVTAERRKERKQFCAFAARARFHTAGVRSCPDGPEVRLPLYPRKRTQDGHRAMPKSAISGSEPSSRGDCCMPRRSL